MDHRGTPVLALKARRNPSRVPTYAIALDTSTTAGEEKTAPPVGALQIGVKSAALPALIGEFPTATPWRSGVEWN
jgi:hypothetical protein